MSSSLHNHPPNTATTICPACMAYKAPRLCDEDIYSFDYYLASVLAEGLPRLKQMGNSYPSNIGPTEWHEILDEMAAGFRDHVKAVDRCSDPDPDKVNRSLDLLRQWFRDLWD